MTTRMQVQIDGEWVDLPTVDAVEFQHRPDPAVEERIAVAARERWTLDLQMQGQAFGRSMHDLFVQAERDAFARRCRERAWLSHPYQPRGAH